MAKTKQKPAKSAGMFAVVVLDATGSMAGEEKRVVGSMNEYVAGLPKGAHLTCFMFDSHRWITHFEDKISKWEPMTESDYVTGSQTPLYDAIARGIAHADTLASKGDRVMVMVDTDGFENASKEHSQESINKIIKARKKDDWAFMFMSAGVDVAQAKAHGKTGVRLGFSAVNTATPSLRGMSYGLASASTTAYFGGVSAASLKSVDVDAFADKQDDDDNPLDPSKVKKSEPFWSAGNTWTSST